MRMEHDTVTSPAPATELKPGRLYTADQDEDVRMCVSCDGYSKLVMIRLRDGAYRNMVEENQGSKFGISYYDVTDQYKLVKEST